MARINGVNQGAGIDTIVSSTDNGITRWDGTSGTLVQDSNVTVSDTGVVDSNGLEVTS